MVRELIKEIKLFFRYFNKRYGCKREESLCETVCLAGFRSTLHPGVRVRVSCFDDGREPVSHECVPSLWYRSLPRPVTGPPQRDPDPLGTSESSDSPSCRVGPLLLLLRGLRSTSVTTVTDECSNTYLTMRDNCFHSYKVVPVPDTFC